MPANTSPIFVLTPNATGTRISAATLAPNGDAGTGAGPINIFTPGANGSRVDSIVITHAGTTAGSISADTIARIYVTDSGAANPRLLTEVQLPTTTRSNLVVGSTQTINFVGGLFLGSGNFLAATQSTGTPFDYFVRGGNY